jgi:hypothetical protein
MRARSPVRAIDTFVLVFLVTTSLGIVTAARQRADIATGRNAAVALPAGDRARG